MHALTPCGLWPPGISGRSPGSQVVTGPRLPGSPQWLPSHGVEGALAAYSDGIAQASHLFPYYPCPPKEHGTERFLYSIFPYHITQRQDLQQFFTRWA